MELVVRDSKGTAPLETVRCVSQTSTKTPLETATALYALVGKRLVVLERNRKRNVVSNSSEAVQNKKIVQRALFLSEVNNRDNNSGH